MFCTVWPVFTLVEAAGVSCAARRPPRSAQAAKNGRAGRPLFPCKRGLSVAAAAAGCGGHVAVAVVGAAAARAVLAEQEQKNDPPAAVVRAGGGAAAAGIAAAVAAITATEEKQKNDDPHFVVAGAEHKVLPPWSVGLRRGRQKSRGVRASAPHTFKL